MRVLFDEGTLLPLSEYLVGYSIQTVQKLGWSGATDRELLARAEGNYDVFITTDRNLRHQQNLSGLTLAILVLPTPSWPKLLHHADKIRDEMNQIKRGECKELKLDFTD
jgi:predicted nuclease of predicted toxin-antitoxin system